MARLHFSGFTGNLAAVGKCEWAAVSGAPTQIAEGGARGTYAMRITSLVSATRQGVGCRVLTAGPTDGTSYFHRFYLRVRTRPAGPNYIFTTGATTLAGPVAGAPALRLD